MHETEANERHQSLLELEERKKVVLQQIQELKQQIQERHQQLQEKDRQLQENVQKIRERDQQIQDYYRSQQSTTFCENIEGYGGIAASEPDITSCDNGRSGPDRLCVLSNPELTRASSTLLFVCELENHDRLPIERLREALQPATELGQASQSTALNAKVKNGVAQSYDYLMESSTGLGILVTVQALVFLRVDWDNPGTLLYHIAAPAEDVAQAMASDAARGISEAT
ncbi:hypothetical protein E4U23_002846, partial [Claviceps purpurea]